MNGPGPDTVYGTFVIVRRWIQRSILAMYDRYAERNDRHANHKQPIFLGVLYRLRNSVLKESHRRNQTSTGEDQTPQNWAYSSEKGRHTERRRVTTIFHPPVKFTDAGASSDIQKYKAHCGKERRQSALHIETSYDRECRNPFECLSTTTNPRSPETRRRIAGKAFEGLAA